MSSSAERERAISVRVAPAGIVRLHRAEGLRITGPLAREAVARVDELDAGLRRPLLVDMTGTATTRLFTSRPAAVAWLCHDDTPS